MPTSIWDHLTQFAERDFSILSSRYRDALKHFPGLSEPVTLISPDFLDRDGEMTPVDVSGKMLPLVADNPNGIVELFESLNADDDPMWICGRLVDHNGTLKIEPLSFAAFSADGGTLYRLQ
ncbi:MAG: hypothetical protein R3A47_08370 [Polyangiales bacterium]